MTFEEVKEFSAIYHHKFMVLKYLNIFIQDLIKRSEEHDNSKFSEDEFLDVIAAGEDLRKCEFGTPEYKQVCEKWKFAFSKHHKKNRHHPEFFQNGIEGMTLIDLLEMLADWKSASLRTDRGGIGDIKKSIKVGAERYNIPPALIKILENTAEMYKM